MQAAETIAAIATAPGDGAISIVRVSGPDSLAIADRIVVCAGRPPSQRPANSFVHGHVRPVGGDTAPIDEIILLIYRAPHSYTCEDSIELQGHGGATAARRILRAVVDVGARVAEPGEFTRRAFLNGRIDLLQAEAVLDLIRARSDRAASAAVEQLCGSLSRSFGAVHGQLMAIAADIEATLDFSEDDLPADVLTGLERRLRATRDALNALILTWDEGHLLREGAIVAILGRPNVGKSTLLNAMLGIRRAIVTDTPGTTRDVIEESMVIDGIAIRIADTAGLRDTQCQVEGEGIRRAVALMERADYVLYVVDGAEPISNEDHENLARLEKDRTVIVINKCDQSVRYGAASFPGWTVVATSLIRDDGVECVRSALARKLETCTATPPHAVISERHRRLAVDARDEVDRAVDMMQGAVPEIVMISAHLRSALESLGLITGREYHDDLLATIFSRFCIGK